MTFRVASWAFLFGNGFVLAACGAPAVLVEPTSFSGERYTELPCDQLGQEKTRLTQALATASKQQATIRRERALELGVELGIGIPIIVGGAIGGAPLDEVDLKWESLGYYDDLSTEIARLKGEIKAVKRTMARKKCRTTSTSTPQSAGAERNR